MTVRPALDFSDHNSKYDQRVRLSVKATVSPNTFGFIELESGDSGDTYTWGSCITQYKWTQKRY